MAKERNKGSEPSPDDLVKAGLVEKYRAAIEGLNPPRPTRVYRISDDLDLSQKTRSFLKGVSSDVQPWEQQLWLASTDLCGCGVPAEEVIDVLIWVVQAWDDEPKRDKALRVIANAYSKPRTPHRSYRGRREGSMNAEFRGRPTCLFRTQSSSVNREFFPGSDGL